MSLLFDVFVVNQRLRTARAEVPGTAGTALPPQAANPGPEEDQEREDRAWKEGVIQAWLAPLLVGSVTERKSPGANKNVEQWLQYLGERTRTRAESDLRLSLEVALAQGFKYAANRRRRHPHARPEARAYLAERAREMLRDSHCWFTRLTLVHALCLWSLPDGQPDQQDRRDADHRALIRDWVAFPGSRPEHPFVVEAIRLAVLALETGQPERFIWIDESGVAARIGSRPANPRAPRKHNLWIPPSTGWTALQPRAQQLVADVLLLLNLAERGAPVTATGGCTAPTGMTCRHASAGTVLRSTPLVPWGWPRPRTRGPTASMAVTSGSAPTRPRAR